WLGTHNGANHVTVYVDVAVRHARGNARYRRIDPRMNAERERSAIAGEIVEHLVEIAAGKTYHVQHRAEDFLIKVACAVEINDGRRNIGASPRHFVEAKAHRTARLHLSDPAFELVFGVAVDHRTNMRCRIARVAEFQFARRADHHLQHAVRDIALYAQEAQGRAALAG